MSTEPTTQEGLNWSPPEPTPVVTPAEAGHERPAGSAAPADPPRVTEAQAPTDGSPLDGVIAKLPPNVQEKPEALVGVAFGAGIGAAIVLRVLGGIIR
jgi:hypothetical protein